MIFKRFMTLVVMASITLLLSCYNVGYDKDSNNVVSNNVDNDEWWDGLSTEQKVKGMEITGELTAADKSGSGFTVTWSYPEEIEGPDFWSLESISIKIGDPIPDLDADSSWTAVDKTIFKNQKGDVWNYHFTDTPVTDDGQYLIYYRVTMNDNTTTNSEETRRYKNIISFVFLPDNYKIQVTSGKSKALADSLLYFYQPIPEEYRLVYKKAMNNYEEGILSDTSPEGFTIPSYKPVIFKIQTDFRAERWGGDWEHKFSNSSYCKVKAVQDGENIKLEYRFEDLPITRLKYETTKEFDYNDVVFYVTIMEQ